MSKKISSQRPDVDALQRAQQARIDQSQGADPASPVQRKAPAPFEADLPERLPGLSGQPSVLQDVIQAGLNSLAHAEGWEATDNALGVLVKAMVGASAPSNAPAPTGQLPMEFSRMLRAFVPPGDAGALKQLKTDAQQLVKLSVVALGTEGLEGSKAKQEAQLEADVGVIKDALSSVLQLPTDERSQVLSATDRFLSWKANVLDRGAKALQTANVDAPARIDALVGILRIVAQYANQAN